MIVKMVTLSVFDVFFGLGWDNWCRFEIIKEGRKTRLKKVKGQVVPANVFHEISRVYGGRK